MKNADIPKTGLLAQIVKEYRDEFVGSFKAEMKPLAGMLFDEYLAAGGLCSEEDLPRLKSIVEENYSEEGNEILIKCAIDEVRFMVRGKTGKAV